MGTYLEEHSVAEYGITDDRTEEEKETRPILVVGTDSFLSGWGLARHGSSFAAWACRSEDVNQVESWVRSRSEMKRVRIVLAKGYRPKGRVHLHIYVVNEGHPAVNRFTW